MIFDYIEGIIDPEENPAFEYSFTYIDPRIDQIDEIEVEFPIIDDDTLYMILMGEGTYPHALTITLLWNAEEDLDITFTCNDGVTLDWNNKAGDNSCGA